MEAAGLQVNTSGRDLLVFSFFEKPVDASCLSDIVNAIVSLLERNWRKNESTGFDFSPNISIDSLARQSMDSGNIGQEMDKGEGRLFQSQQKPGIDMKL